LIYIATFDDNLSTYLSIGFQCERGRTRFGSFEDIVPKESKGILTRIVEKPSEETLRVAQGSRCTLCDYTR